MTSYIIAAVVIALISASLLVFIILIINAMAGRVSALEDELQRSSEVIEELGAEIESLRSDVDSLRDELETLNCDAGDASQDAPCPASPEDVWMYEPCKSGEPGVTVIAYTGEEPLSGRVVIPYTLGGSPVTALGSRLFYECKHIEEVVIPETVSRIGDAAFCICNSLRAINFPAAMHEIPADCFNECGFTDLTIPDTVTSIRRGAFINNRQLQSISLPSGITEISMMTFAGCSSLSSVEVPGRVTRIGDGAFNDCRALSEVSLPDSLTSIGMMAFLACRALRRVRIPASVASIGDLAFPDWIELIRE